MGMEPLYSWIGTSHLHGDAGGDDGAAVGTGGNMRTRPNNAVIKLAAGGDMGILPNHAIFTNLSKRRDGSCGVNALAVR